MLRLVRSWGLTEEFWERRPSLIWVRWHGADRWWSMDKLLVEKSRTSERLALRVERIGPKLSGFDLHVVMHSL